MENKQPEDDLFDRLNVSNNTASELLTLTLVILTMLLDERGTTALLFWPANSKSYCHREGLDFICLFPVGLAETGTEAMAICLHRDVPIYMTGLKS